MKENRKWTFFLLIMLASVFLFMTPGTVEAASFKNSKPKITYAKYVYDKASLKWTKVAGATKYQIFRREMNPRTGKYGKFRLWATTSNTSIRKKTTGDYQYVIRAVRGKTYSKWSNFRRIFAASAKIMDKTYEAGGFLTIKIRITNKSRSSIGLMKGYVDESRKSDIQFLNSKGKKVDSYKGDLYSGSIWTDDNYMTEEIPAKGSKNIYLRTSISSMTWWNYPAITYPTDLQHHAMRIITYFYPNPNVENKKIRIVYNTNVKNSWTG